MQEASTLFNIICNSRWFLETSIILVGNKIESIDGYKEQPPVPPLA